MQLLCMHANVERIAIDQLHLRQGKNVWDAFDASEVMDVAEAWAMTFLRCTHLKQLALIEEGDLTVEGNLGALHAPSGRESKSPHTVPDNRAATASFESALFQRLSQQYMSEVEQWSHTIRESVKEENTYNRTRVSTDEGTGKIDLVPCVPPLRVPTLSFQRLA